MNLLWKTVREVVAGKPERWDEESDETVLFLRDERDRALREARRLRAMGIPLTGNILEDNATGAASRYRRARRQGLL